MLLLVAVAVVGLDHIPLAVRDLDAAAADYRRLGFTLKQGRPHADGIRNLHAKFRDGTEIELITAPAARDELTSFYVDFLKSGDGPAFLGLYAPDLDAADAALDVPHAREGGLVALKGPLRWLFIGGRNASPTDLPEHFEHPNGADGLIGVWLASEGGAHAGREEPQKVLRALGATLSREEVAAPRRSSRTVARFASGEVVFLPASRQPVRGRPIVGAVLRTRSLEAARRALAAAGVLAVDGDRSLFVRPEDAHGLWLELRER
jgi:catechol 2,3-dioxygenase-like lactoylglutathione lyase family enzyme